MRTWVQHRLPQLLAVVMGASTVFLPLTVPAAYAQEGLADSVTVDIPPQRLDSALIELSRQTGVEVLMSSETVQGMETQGARGTMPLAEALARLLKGTPLGYHAAGAKTISIQAARQGADNGQIDIAQAPAAQGTMTDGTAPVDPAAVDPGVATEPTTESVTSGKRGGIEEVIVTARRRAESIENIPISITALSAEDLKNFGIRNFADLEGVVPGLNLGGGGNGVKKDSSPFIRGVGQRETKVTLDPAVATYIDGIYIGRAAGAMLDITDVESVQVLRGPQGTLFGRNATGGAISVSLKKPKNEWGVSLGTNIGNYHRRDFSMMVNAPLIDDTLLGRIFVSTANSRGYFTNVVDDEDWGGDNRVTGIAQLRYVPTDNLTIDVLGERTHIRETPRPQKCAYMRPANSFETTQLLFLNIDFSTGGFVDVDGYKRHEGLCRRSMALKSDQFASDLTDEPGSLLPKGRYWVDTSTAGLTANWEIGDIGPISGVNLKSITAWRETKQIADEDLDAIVGTYLVRIQPDFDETTQISEELQLSGKAFDGRLFVSTGLYYFQEETPRSDLILSAGIGEEYFLPAGAFGPVDAYGRVIIEPAKERLATDNEAYAWYSQLDFDITPEIQLTGGVRWTRENRWGRYSKTYSDPTRVADNYLFDFTLTSAVQLTGYAEPGGFRAPLEWQYAARDFFFIGPQPGPIDYVLTPDLFVGDELSMSDEAWTPMASLKYRANDGLLEALGLDQAMVYATYSQGFHSGGVTAGAIEKDAYIGAGTGINDPAVTEIPCGVHFVNSDGTCPNRVSIPEPGYGTADPIIFRPEKVTNYEVGFKVAGLDRRLQSNVAVFYMDYTDMQTTAVGDRFGIPVPYIENVGKSVIKGIEAEIVAMPLPQWRIFANGSYTDADIKDWQARSDRLGADGTSAGDFPYAIDRSDERMPRVPRLQLFASTEYSFDFGTGGTLTPSIGVRYVSSIYHGFDRGSWLYSYGGYRYGHDGDLPPYGKPDCINPCNPNWNRDRGSDPYVNPDPSAKWETTSRPVTFLDARIAWISANGRMEVAAWGKNLTNVDDYLVGGIPLVDVTGAVGQVYANPRTFGLSLNYSFGAQ